jgi:hypothetical protein
MKKNCAYLEVSANSKMRNFIHNLDKNNFFYNSITTLAYAQFGVLELISRGFMIKALKAHPDPVDFQKYIESCKFNSDIQKEICKTITLTPLIFVPGFSTKDKKRTYEFSPNQSSIEFLNDTNGITQTNIELTHMTILTSWEKIIHFNLSGPVFEFFRHIRNASAHDGKFNFYKKVLSPNGELLKIAKWRDFEIKSSYKNMNLLIKTKDDNDGFFDQGDVVEFLLDFEKHYPEIKKN